MLGDMSGGMSIYLAIGVAEASFCCWAFTGFGPAAQALYRYP